MAKQCGSILEFIREFVALQDGLMNVFRRHLGVRDWTLLSDVPSTGKLIHDGVEWGWRVHGLGVRFCDGVRVVDMNRALDGESTTFDAGRLVDYGSSLGGVLVEHNGRSVLLDDFDVASSVLGQLRDSGSISDVRGADGEMFRLAEDTGPS